MVRQKGPKLGEMFGLKDKTKESAQVIDSFGFDNEIYADIYDQSPAMQETVEEGDGILKTFPDLAQDIFMSLYKHRPTMLEEQDVKDTHGFNHALMQEFMDTDEFRQLRRKTRLDMISSALGSEIMGGEAVTVLQHYEQQLQEEARKKGEQQTEFDKINEEYGNDGGSSAPGGSGDGAPQPGQPGSGQPGQGQGGMSHQQGKDLANQQAQNNQGPGQGQPQPQSNGNTGMDPQKRRELMDKMKQDLQKAAKSALDDVSELRDFLDAWGMSGGDPNNRISYEEKKRALQRLRGSEKLKKMSELIGRMKKLAINEQKEKMPDGAEAIKSVKTGNRIENVLPSEKAQLSSNNKALNRMFYRKYQDKELLEYDKDVHESAGKGPMICCVDTSGSMGGEREKWSKAVALALLEVANKQKRNYACIHYDWNIAGVWEIPHGQLNPDAVFDIAEQFSGGGTDFEKPLKKSMEIMENSKFRKGDIVFITDGDCSVSDKFLEEFRKMKKEKEFKVYTVLIDAYGGGATNTVKEFSDKIIQLSDLAKLGDTTAQEIFRNV